MAKKKNSNRKPKERVAKPKVSGGKTAVEKKLSKDEQFRLEYAYVLKDLRTVFILAGIMFALLIALNIFLR
ncbi:MAG: hypothetical protein AAF490_25055 [Chloroflexota bacterium]